MINAKHVLFLSLFTAAAALTACSGADADPQRSSSAGLPKGRIDMGETQASVKGQATGQSCVDCHGADGNQPLDPTYPLIGGQHADYLAFSLQQYRSGSRDHALMSNQAQGLSDQQIADLAAFFGAQDAKLQDLGGAYY